MTTKYKLTTKYKWLPSEPTIEMLDAVFALEEPNTLREYEAMWKVAPAVEQEPKLWLSPEGFRIKLTKPEAGEISGWFPLYTHPQPPEVEQEPYAYATLWENGEWSVVQGIEPNTVEQVPLYTHPRPKRESLDDETILGIARTIPNLSGDDNALLAFARELGV